jgi:dihydropteroate synthase
MHTRGSLENMQNLTNYNDFYTDILKETFSKANYLKKNGVKDVIIDPGFGFAKDLHQNYDLMKNLSIFKNENYPFLIGISRKSMIYKYLEIDIKDTLEATSQLNLNALFSGTSILRVHDAKSAKHTIDLYNLLKKL